MARHEALPDRFLGYVQRLDIVSQTNLALSGSRGGRGSYPDPVTSMYVVKHATWANGTPIGGIVPLHEIRALANLVPRFGDKADQRLTTANSLTYSTEFWLNKYFDKEIFYALDNM